MKTTTTRTILILAGSALPLLAGCAVAGKGYAAPAATVPVAWTEADGAADPSGVREAWWAGFEDPVLDRLVRRALESGPDRREAMARLREARALRGVAGAARYPAADGAGAYQHRGDSDHVPGGLPARYDLHTAGLDASWELDLWGGVRRSVEAAEADLGAAAEEARGVFLAVAAEVAANYVELRAWQRRLAIARTNVGLQEDTLALVRARYDAGFVGARDLAQATTNVAVTRARVPELEAGERAAANRIAVLLGVAPGTLGGELDAVPAIPVPPSEIAAGVPADVVRQRPDVRRAERLLAAEHARGGVARAALYPQLTLGGSLGVAASDADDLLRSGSGVFGVGPSVRWRLFDAGRLRHRIQAQDARVEQALVRWERAILTSLEEAESALSSFVRGHLRRRDLVEAVSAARRAVDLARIEYREGQSDFQAVLDSERALAQLEDELAVTESGIAARYIALHKALGSS